MPYELSNPNDLAAARFGLKIADVLRANTRVAAIGDSIILALGAPTAALPSPTGETANSIIQWAMLYSDNRVFLPRDGNRGIGGQSIATIAGRFTTDLAPLKPKIIIADGGINNTSDMTAAQIKGWWDSMITQAAAMGAILIILPILPSSPGVPYDAVRLDVNAYLLSKQSAAVYVIDTNGYDHLIHTYPENGAFGPAGIRIHQNVVGAQLLGRRCAEIINALVDPAPRIPGNGGDAANLFAAMRMRATGGSLAGGATGAVVNGWTLDRGDSGITCVGAVVDRPDGGKAQQITLTGAYTGSGKKVQMYSGSQALAGFAAGDFAVVSADLELDAGAANIDTVSLYALFQTSAYAFIADCSVLDMNTANTSGGYVPGAFSVTARSKPVPLAQAAAFANVFASVVLKEGGSASPASGVARISNVRVERL